MKFLIELLFELIYDDALGIARNAKMSRWARYPFIALISAFILGVIGGIGAAGVLIIVKHEDSAQLAAGFLLLALDLILILSTILKIVKQINDRKILKGMGVTADEKDYARSK